MKLSFVVQDGGDPDAGIGPLNTSVSMELDFVIPDSDTIDYFRDVIAEYYDVSVKNVYTQEEIDKREAILNRTPEG